MILEALSYSREAVDQGQWWRLATASLAHLSAAHALGNVLGLVLLACGLHRVLSLPLQAWVLATGAVATGLGLHLLTGLDWYAGLSGALWALAGCGACRLAQLSRVPGRVMLSLLALAVHGDQYRTLSWTGEPLAPQAHLYGFVAGVGCALLLAALQRRPAKPWSRPARPGWGSGRWPDQSRLNQSRLDQNWPGQSRPGQNWPDQSRPDQSWQSGTAIRMPSISSRIRIWQLRRLFGRRSAAVYSSISSSTRSGAGSRSSQSSST